MRPRVGATLVTLALVGAGAGARLGPPGRMVAQTGGTSSSSGTGSGSSGSSGAGSSGSSQDGSSAGGSSSGDGSSGDGSSGSGTGGNGGTGGDEGRGGGAGGGTPPDSGGPGKTAPGGAATTAPAAIPQPTTPSSIPADRVGEGEPSDCGPEFAVGLRCFDVGDGRGIRGVRVPDGIGGFVIVPIAPVPVVNVDTGASTSASSNVDLRIGVNGRTGEVVRVKRRADARRQRGFATIAILLLAVIAAASVATYLRVRRLGSP
ncbi:MAG TPA: hypothetical protein VHM89_15660 [Acidimicrobiales bacterium]|nr:hypothetical protein [Acidimicrobiales bacterium]